MIVPILSVHCQEATAKDLRSMYNVGTLARMKRRKPESLRKQATIQIRVSQEHKRILAEAAQRAGLDLSTWLRLLGLREAGQIQGLDRKR